MSDDGQMPDLGSLMNLAQKLQGDVAKMQDELEHMQCEGSAGGGMVRATVNGHYELVGLTIESEVVDPNDVAMLQDLVIAAVNNATANMREKAQQEMGKLTGGLNIPGMPKLF
jgi:DNA-binding YbaB/EbfC family protein